jgi:alkylhydroperoxidase family enzyme
MLEYVYKLTKTPDKIKKADIEVLHKSGFSDKDILEINLITGYFNFVNRIASGLGVEYTPKEVKGYKY